MWGRDLGPRMTWNATSVFAFMAGLYFAWAAGNSNGTAFNIALAGGIIFSLLAIALWIRSRRE